jgi:hypothetical protein
MQARQEGCGCCKLAASKLRQCCFAYLTGLQATLSCFLSTGIQLPQEFDQACVSIACNASANRFHQLRLSYRVPVAKCIGVSRVKVCSTRCPVTGLGMMMMMMNFVVLRAITSSLGLQKLLNLTPILLSNLEARIGLAGPFGVSL